MRAARWLALAALLLTASGTAVAAGPAHAADGAGDDAPATREPPAVEPLEVGLEERVGVQLVLVDLLVLDRNGATVGGLGPDDFLLLVDGREVTPASVDTTCPGRPPPDAREGQGADRTGRRGGEAARRPDADGGDSDEDGDGGGPGEGDSTERRIVLAFDYFHMENASVAIDAALDALERWTEGGEEHMVVALSQTLHVEVPFTRDVEAVRYGLQRMRHDPRLYGGAHGALSLHRYFERLESLHDVLERVPGRKSIVLFSGPLLSDGFYHDVAYQRLGAMSTTSRAAIYPVDTGGLRTPLDPLASPLGGPPRLRRLATETGGRMTADTNDIALAYGRAHRDQGCVYTLGFQDEDPDLDEKNRLTVRLRDPAGRRVIYPEFYLVRSREEKRRALARTAELAPGAFGGAGVAADLFLVGPRGTRRWEALVGVRVEATSPAPGETGPPAEGRPPAWRVRGLLRTPTGALIRSFRRELRASVTGEPVTMFHPLSVPAGRYTLSVVVGDPVAPEPRTAVREIVVPEIPRRETFIVGPLLGRRHLGGSGTRTGGGDDAGDRQPALEGFQPLLVQHTAQGATLESLTRVCRVGGGAEAPRAVSRAVVGGREGTIVLAFETVEVTLPEARGVRCETLRDVLATRALPPGGYEMQVSAIERDVVGTGAAPFEILP